MSPKCFAALVVIFIISVMFTIIGVANYLIFRDMPPAPDFKDKTMMIDDDGTIYFEKDSDLGI